MKNTTSFLKSLSKILILIAFFSCSSNNNVDDDFGFTNDVYDGKYCAEITYYNPRTGTESTYDLEVEVSDNELIRILWPNGGWLDQDHFNPVEFNEDGYCEFTSDKDYEYSVQIVDRNCNNSSYQHNRTHDQPSEDGSICPNCGEEKDEYDELCSECEYENY